MIVDDDGVIAFVEVKARRGDLYGHPAEAVNALKQRRLVSAARSYLGRENLFRARCRFDVFCVTTRGGRARVEWIRDAFRPL